MRRVCAILIALAALLFVAPAQALSPFFVFFAPGSARLTPQALAILDNAAQALVTAQVTEIEIGGATDRVGSEAGNMALSRRRAEAVHSALIARGMPRTIVVRITAKGEADPLVETEDGVPEAQNRLAYVLLRRVAPTSPIIRHFEQQ